MVISMSELFCRFTQPKFPCADAGHSACTCAGVIPPPCGLYYGP
jgi:hypothetical protein